MGREPGGYWGRAGAACCLSLAGSELPSAFRSPGDPAGAASMQKIHWLFDVSTSSEEVHTTASTDPRLILNDDGWLTGHGPDPLTPEIIHERMVSTYEGSTVEAVCWCGSNSEVCRNRLG